MEKDILVPLQQEEQDLLEIEKKGSTLEKLERTRELNRERQRRWRKVNKEKVRELNRKRKVKNSINRRAELWAKKL